MKKTKERDDAVRKLCEERRVFTLNELKLCLGTRSTMTVFRSLSRLSYLTSYSHRGRFYTLPSIPDFDMFGLWSDGPALFSQNGNLLETIEALVVAAEAGYTSNELEGLLKVEVKHALLKLVRRKTLERKKCGSGAEHVYFSSDKSVRYQQELNRSGHDFQAGIGGGVNDDMLCDEIRAGIILFFSLLDEKQRRLYAGLEAGKLGYGGDQKIATLFGLDPHTVAKGRRELFGGTVDRDKIRIPGGGRKTIEKKRQT